MMSQAEALGTEKNTATSSSPPCSLSLFSCVVSSFLAISLRRSYSLVIEGQAYYYGSLIRNTLSTRMWRCGEDRLALFFFWSSSSFLLQNIYLNAKQRVDQLIRERFEPQPRKKMQNVWVSGLIDGKGGRGRWCMGQRVLMWLVYEVWCQYLANEWNTSLTWLKMLHIPSHPLSPSVVQLVQLYHCKTAAICGLSFIHIICTLNVINDL